MLTMTRVLLILIIFITMTRCQKQCPKNKVDKRQFYKWTQVSKVGGKVRPVADAPCWFDLTRSDCARCRNNGKQCGAPMQRWCQSPKSKGGCPGVPRPKYTLSSTGFPCFWDHTDLSCAWCVNKQALQCDDSVMGDNCGRYCSSGKPVISLSCLVASSLYFYLSVISQLILISYFS